MLLERIDRRHHRKRRLPRGHRRQPLAHPDRRRQILAAQLVELWLVVERFELRRCAGLKQVNDPLCLGLRNATDGTYWSVGRSRRRGDRLLRRTHERTERERAQAGARPLQKVPPIHRLRYFFGIHNCLPLRVRGPRHQSFEIASSIFKMMLATAVCAARLTTSSDLLRGDFAVAYKLLGRGRRLAETDPNTFAGSLAVRQVRSAVGARLVARRNANVSCESAELPPSVNIRSANFRAASMYVTSLSNASACSGVLVLARFTWQISQLGASNVAIDGCGTVRLRYVYKLRRYKIVAVALRVIVVGTAGQFFPQAGRLIRHDRRAADLIREQPADGERIVAHRFGLQPIAGPARSSRLSGSRWYISGAASERC